MSDDNIHGRLNRLFRETFDNETIQIFDDMTARDLEEWDSVSNISLMLAIEKEFGISFSTSQISSLENVGAMISLIRDRQGRR